MSKLFHKDISLCTQTVTWFMLAASVMTLLPGYPILVGTFLVCLGIFHTYQLARESNDILYSVLLPVKKGDVVKAKYLQVLLFEMIAFAVMALLTVLRMTVMAGAMPYVKNAMMNATPYYLAWVLLIFTAFNVFFVGGFFKTGWAMGKPFLIFGIVTFLMIAVAEVLHHLPGLTFLNEPGGARLGLQCGLLAAAAVIYAVGTLLSCRGSVKRFEKLDL